MPTNNLNDLRARIDKTRIWITWSTIAAFFICALVASTNYQSATNSADGTTPPSIWKTLGHISGIYLPIISAILAFLWSTKARSQPPPAPHGIKMAVLRDRVTRVLFTFALGCPIVVYGVTDLSTANNLMLGYQTTLLTFIAGGLYYYFGTDQVK